MEAVMKKFHGNSVPKPRMKKMMPTRPPLRKKRRRRSVTCYRRPDGLMVGIPNPYMRLISLQFGLVSSY